MHFALTLLHRNLIIARADARLILIRALIQPAVYLFVFGHVVGRMVSTDAGGYGSVVAPGIIAIAVVTAPFITIGGSVLAGYFYRTLEEWLLAPVSLRTVFIAMVASGLCSSLANSLLVAGLVWLILGLAPQDLACFLLVIISGGLLFSLLILIVLLVPERPDKGQEVFSLLMMLMTFFGCTFYSYDMLEPPFRWIALLLPTTYISEGLRAAYMPGAPHLDVLSLVTGMTSATLALFLLADFVFRRRLGHFAW
ncbi:MAG: ABC transporter permease [Pseudomonadota bacterium]|jgi:ABC-2 type transport system permease protein